MAYQLAVAGVRSLGFLPSGNWHAMLAWAAEANGGAAPGGLAGDRVLLEGAGSMQLYDWKNHLQRLSWPMGARKRTSGSMPRISGPSST